MKKFARILAALFAALLLFSCAACASDGGKSGEVIIYHTNDVHGYVGEEDGVGLAKVAALHASTPNSILVDAGDATQGLPIASLTQGADIIELMGLAGYDAMAPGNHEFDFGIEVLLRNAGAANFPMLAANVTKDGAPLLGNVKEGQNGCNTVIDCGGFRIGLFGITTTETRTATNPTLLTGVEFGDEIAAAKAQIDALEDAGADAIVALCHMGNGSAPLTSIALAEAMTGEYAGKLDAIIDGHSHTVIDEEVNGVLVVQTGTGLAQVGELTLRFENGAVTASDRLLSAEDVANVQPDAAVAQKLNEIDAQQSVLLGEQIGTLPLPATLWAGYVGQVAIARAVETTLGDFVADALHAAGKSFARQEGLDLPVVAVENGGGIRASLPAGKVTLGDLVTAFPYSNTVFIKEVTPKLLYEMMELSGQYLDGQNEQGMLLQEQNWGGFLQVAGFTVRFDTEAPQGERVLSVTLDGSDAPLDREDTSTRILLAGNNYIMEGGNEYSMLAGLEKLGETGGELEAVRAYFEGCDASDFQEYLRPQGRIQMTSGNYTPAPYLAKVLVLGADGAPAANTPVSYRLDGGEEEQGQTDENGFLRLTVADGAHSIRIGSGAEAYIDNYCGFGLISDQYRGWPTLRLAQ